MLRRPSTTTIIPRLRTRHNWASRLDFRPGFVICHPVRNLHLNRRVTDFEHRSLRAFSSSPASPQSDVRTGATSPKDFRAYAEAAHEVYAAKMVSGRLSNLDLMQIADTFPYPDKPSQSAAHTSLTQALYTFIWRPSSQPLGYIPSTTIHHLLSVPESIRGPVTIDHALRTIHIFDTFPTEAERTAAVGRVMTYFRENNTFSMLRGWRDELWPVYGGGGSDDKQEEDHKEEVLFSIERSATGILGVTRYGVHMNAYIPAPAGGKPEDIKLWVPRRSETKETYPGMLDNTVAGGLMTGEDPFECIVREADEEASLPESIMRDGQRLKEAGIVSLIHITGPGAGGEKGQIYPKVDWVYDLELRDGGNEEDGGGGVVVVPTPKDGEVAGFELMSVSQVKEELSKGRFKPNCALIMLGFFVRHGILAKENEGDFDEIVAKMHRRLPFPGPHQKYFQ